MNRDAQGRFTTAQHADALAAERLLERAVAEAVRVLRPRRSPFDYDAAEEVLRHAGHAADLLMGGAA